MKIIRDEQAATWTLVPVEASEEQVITDIIAILKPEDRIFYDGRDQDGDDDKFSVIYLYAGARKEKQDKTVNKNIINTRSIYIGGVKLILRGSTKKDKYEVNGIRNTCYFGSGGLIFLGGTEVDGKKAVITTAKRCKHCGAGMIDLVSCEWSTCDACAAKCEHNYDYGFVHGRGREIGMDDFCDKCGRVKPPIKEEQE
jgi:hypothetical protein